MRSRRAAAIAFAFAVLVPILLLVAWWRPLPGPSSAYALGGRLPWSDGFDYWSAAQHLLQQGVLDEWGSRRPINGAFLAARLAITGDRLLGALLVQSLLLSVAFGALVFAAIVRFGAAAGVALGALGLVPIAVVQTTTQSEGLGLLLAIASMAWLLRACGAWSRSEPRPDSLSGVGALSVGTALLTMAMLARPGAPFMVPAIAIGAIGSAWRRRGGRAAVTAATGVVAAVAIGFGANAAARLLHADPSALANANFAGTMLGIARGSDYYEADAWLRSQLDPWSGERERSELAYRETWRLVLDQPQVAVRTLARNLGAFAWRAWPLLIAAGIGIWRSPRSERCLWISGWAGILLSVPVVFGDGGIRCLAASWPFMIASAASALRRRAPSPAPHACERRWSAAGAGAAIVAVALAIVGPAVARPLGLLGRLPRHGTFEADQYPAPGAEWVDWVRGEPAFLALVIARDSERSALPAGLRSIAVMDPEALRRDPEVREFGGPVESIETPFLLCVAYDLGQRRARILAVEASEATAAALAAGSWALRIDTVPLRPGSRVSVVRALSPVRREPP